MATILSNVLLGACTVFGIRSGTEEPPYQVLDLVNFPETSVSVSIIILNTPEMSSRPRTQSRLPSVGTLSGPSGAIAGWINLLSPSASASALRIEPRVANKIISASIPGLCHEWL
jgi:hypothetical protein